MTPDKVQKRITSVYGWAIQKVAASPPNNVIARTRDVFRARLDQFYRELIQASWSDADSALLTAVVGEIGNNSFDHNLGQWRDEPGCWFEWDLSIPQSMFVLLADRGQGVLASLGRVDASIKTDQEALEAAFSRILSGRSPEKRGNGLKFVKHIINGESKRGLLFCSGEGRIVLGRLGPLAETYLGQDQSKKVLGTWALLLGEKP